MKDFIQVICIIMVCLCALAQFPLYKMYKELGRRKRCYRKGEEVKVPIEYNPQDGVLVVQGKEISVTDELGAEALANGFARGWQMDDGVLLELDLLPCKNSRFLEEVKPGVKISGVDAITSVAGVQECIVREPKLNRIFLIVETCAGLSIVMGVFSFVIWALNVLDFLILG